jgi:hypothetical protein
MDYSAEKFTQNGRSSGNVGKLYHLKKKPQNVLWAMYIMSMTSHKAGRKAFALFPLRRSHVPRHVRFDQRVVNDVLRLESKAPTLAEFAAFGAERRRILRECIELEFCNDLCHRNRRRNSRDLQF